VKVVQGEQEEDDSMYYMEDEEEDYRNEVKVSSELGDYELLQYRGRDPKIGWSFGTHLRIAILCGRFQWSS
jgi:hypothetical protein